MAGTNARNGVVWAANLLFRGGVGGAWTWKGTLAEACHLGEDRGDPLLYGYIIPTFRAWEKSTGFTAGYTGEPGVGMVR